MFRFLLFMAWITFVSVGFQVWPFGAALLLSVPVVAFIGTMWALRDRRI